MNTTTRHIAAWFAMVATMVGAAAVAIVASSTPTTTADTPAWSAVATVGGPALGFGHRGRAPRIVYVERYAPRRFYVATNRGAAYTVRRCRWEDSARPCVWDARRRGNGVGRSFARLTRGADPVYIRPRVMRRAY